MHDDELAIEASGLTKRYGEHLALDGLDLAIPAGSVCGLLGPNGAGKTTAVRILTTLLRPDAGQARVAGADLVRSPQDVRRRIGLSGQEPAVDEILSGRQNLVLFGRLDRLDRATARRRADELLALMGLEATGSKAVKHYSGGMRRRLDLAVTLLLEPAVLFLDEPTTGLDPRSRAEVWDALRGLVARGTTLVLTTQYLDEADQLADRIVVLDRGRRIAEGSPDQLKAQVGGDQLLVDVDDPADVDRTATVLAAATGEAPVVDRERRRVTTAAPERVATLVRAVQALSDAAVPVADIGLRRPTLDDVFLQLTGRSADEAERGPERTEPGIDDPAPTGEPLEEALR